MAKFCTKCGKKLEGKPCDCEKEKKEEVTSAEEMQEEAPDTLNYLNAFIEMTKDMFQKPITALKENIRAENWVTGMIAIFINAFILSGFICLVMRERFEMFPFEMSLLSTNISYAKIMIQSFVSISVLYFAFAGIIYIITDTICKSKTSYLKMVSFLGTVSTVTIVIDILAILCIYLSSQLMTIVFLTGCFLFLFYLYKGFSFTAKIDENKVPYILVSAMMILFILAAYVIPGILN